MIDPVASPYLVPFDGKFRIRDAPTGMPKKGPSKAQRVARLAELREELAELQNVLYADDRWAVLLIFQAMDAAGKDSTIRHVFTGVNPAGCEVTSFKVPSDEELEHDFLWRSAKRLPRRGNIGIFNRSYYEEVLAVRVHPTLLERQHLPSLPKKLERVWDDRFEAIREHERHLARSGVAVVKFWLNVSRREQAERFLARLEEPEKHWKFRAADVDERAHWPDYMAAYEEALNATSRPWAPWYAIPADSKSFMRMTVADIVVRTMQGLGLRYPEVEPELRARFDELVATLKAEIEG